MKLTSRNDAKDVLWKSLGKFVVIELKNKRILKAMLEGFDEHLNLLLKDAEDVSNTRKVLKLGRIILRGDTIVLISPSTHA